MFTADAHCDTALRIAHENLYFDQEDGLQVTAARLKEGNVGLQLMACFAGSQGVSPQARQFVLDALSVCDELERSGMLTFITSIAEQPPMDGVTRALRTIEGGEALEGSLQSLEEFIARGVRLITLLWNHENEIGHSALSGDVQGLKPFGKTLLQTMRTNGIAVDVSHLNETGFWDVMEWFSAPVIASHSCVKTLHDHPRNLNDAQIDALIEQQGFIGINFYPVFLTGAAATIHDIVRHIDYIVQRGGARTVGFGSDFDGIGTCPQGLDGPHRFPAILEQLEKLGYPSETVADIAGLNLWRTLHRSTMPI